MALACRHIAQSDRTNLCRIPSFTDFRAAARGGMEVDGVVARVVHEVIEPCRLFLRLSMPHFRAVSASADTARKE